MANAPQGIDRFRCNDCGKLEFDWNHRADNPESHDFNGSPLQSCPAAVGDTETPPAPTDRVSRCERCGKPNVVDYAFLVDSDDTIEDMCYCPPAPLDSEPRELPLDLARLVENLRHYQSGSEYERNKAAEVIRLMESALATHTRSLAALRSALVEVVTKYQAVLDANAAAAADKSLGTAPWSRAYRAFEESVRALRATLETQP